MSSLALPMAVGAFEGLIAACMLAPKHQASSHRTYRTCFLMTGTALGALVPLALRVAAVVMRPLCLLAATAACDAFASVGLILLKGAIVLISSPSILTICVISLYVSAVKRGILPTPWAPPSGSPAAAAALESIPEDPLLPTDLANAASCV